MGGQSCPHTDFARPRARIRGSWRRSVLRLKRGPSFGTTFRQKRRNFRQNRTSFSLSACACWRSRPRVCCVAIACYKIFSTSVWSIFLGRPPRPFAKNIDLHTFDYFKPKRAKIGSLLLGRLAEARPGNRWKIKKIQGNSRKSIDFHPRPRNFEAFREFSKDSGSKFLQNPPSRPAGTRPELEPSAGRRPAGEGRPEERKIRSPGSKNPKKCFGLDTWFRTP